jgi:hypothetical protein
MSAVVCVVLGHSTPCTTYPVPPSQYFAVNTFLGAGNVRAFVQLPGYPVGTQFYGYSVYNYVNGTNAISVPSATVTILETSTFDNIHAMYQIPPGMAGVNPFANGGIGLFEMFYQQGLNLTDLNVATNLAGVPNVFPYTYGNVTGTGLGGEAPLDVQTVAALAPGVPISFFQDTADTVLGTALYIGTETTFAHTGLVNGTLYTYRVCAVDNAGNTSTGATASAAPAP